MWYVFGEYVLDKIMGYSRCRRISVFYSGSLPHRTEISKSLDIAAQHLEIEFQDSPPKIICEIDNFIIKPSGKIFHLTSNQKVEPKPPLHINQTIFELKAEDILKLWHLHKVYPELIFSDVLLNKVKNDYEYYLSIKKDFEELNLLILKNFSKQEWRQLTLQRNLNLN